MPVYDLLIEGATLVTEDGLVDANIAIEGEKIAAVTKGVVSATKKLNLSGKLVMPGIIDNHAHIREPGYTYKEDFETGSKAAAAGGVTTFFDMPNCEPPTDSLQTFEDKRRLASKKSVVDFNHIVFPKLSEVSKIANAGAIGFKIFQVRGAYPHDPRICVEDHATLYQMFASVQKTGLPCMVHPSNMSLFEMYYKEHRKEEPKDLKFISFGKAYIEELIYGTSVSLLIKLARETKVRLHLVHTHSESAIEEIRRAKADGVNVTAQVDPKYFVTTKEELSRMGGLVLPGGLLSEHRVATVWNALKDGTIDVLATDHAPHTREEVNRMMAKNPWEAPFGCPQLEHYLSVFLNEVNEGRLTLDQLLRMAVVNPSKIMGIFPKKGKIQVGSDADLVVVDMKKEKKLTEKNGVYSKVGWTPYEGRKVRGVPIITIRRGEIIMEDSEVIGKPGSGKFVRPLKPASRVSK